MHLPLSSVPRWRGSQAIDIKAVTCFQLTAAAIQNDDQTTAKCPLWRLSSFHTGKPVKNVISSSEGQYAAGAQVQRRWRILIRSAFNVLHCFWALGKTISGTGGLADWKFLGAGCGIRSCMQCNPPFLCQITSSHTNVHLCNHVTTNGAVWTGENWYSRDFKPGKGVWRIIASYWLAKPVFMLSPVWLILCHYFFDRVAF